MRHSASKGTLGHRYHGLWWESGWYIVLHQYWITNTGYSVLFACILHFSCCRWHNINWTNQVKIHTHFMGENWESSPLHKHESFDGASYWKVNYDIIFLLLKLQTPLKCIKLWELVHHYTTCVWHYWKLDHFHALLNSQLDLPMATRYNKVIMMSKWRCIMCRLGCFFQSCFLPSFCSYYSFQIWFCWADDRIQNGWDLVALRQ